MNINTLKQFIKQVMVLANSSDTGMK